MNCTHNAVASKLDLHGAESALFHRKMFVCHTRGMSEFGVVSPDILERSVLSLGSQASTMDHN